MSDDVVVVGGGVVGLAIADVLAGEGLRVRLLEADATGSGASGAAAGMLAPIHEACHEASDGASVGTDVGTEAAALFRLGLESLGAFPALCARLTAETGIDPELEASGLLRVAIDEDEGRRLVRRRADLARLAGGVAGAPADSEAVVGEWLDAASLRREVPGLHSDRTVGCWSPLECHLKPPRLVRALEASARRRGATIECGVRVERVERRGDRVEGVRTHDGLRVAGQVVLAAGPWTPALIEASGLAEQGVPTPAIEPVRGQILALGSPLPEMRAITCFGDAYLVPKRDGRWVVGATEERVGFDRRVTAEGVAALIARATALFPALADATFERAWAGLRPVSRDGRPWLGPVPGLRGLHLAAGHGRNGVLLAPVTAARLRDGVLGKDTPEAMRCFAPDPARLA